MYAVGPSPSLSSFSSSAKFAVSVGHLLPASATERNCSQVIFTGSLRAGEHLPHTLKTFLSAKEYNKNSLVYGWCTHGLSQSRSIPSAFFSVNQRLTEAMNFARDAAVATIAEK